MSVINKMLRDLDTRRSDGALPDLSREVRSTAMQGTVSVEGDRNRSRLPWLLVPAVLLVAGAAAWYWITQSSAPSPAPASVAVVVAPPLAAPVPQSAASAPDAGPGGPSAALPESAEPVAVQVAEPEVPVPKASRPSRAAEVSKPEPVTASRTGKEKKPLARSDGEPSGRAVAAASGPSAASVSAVQAPAPRRQPAVQETLTQAQNLWATGSREAAVALLREAVVVAEKVPDADVQLPPVARELARMELAQGRSGAALDLLTRLEPRLAGHSDLWAMRGNAAQRLGRHAESVQAYQRALQLRPGEQRWLLGAAVSLAALGQADSAAQYAEQARALGPVSAEVLAYLRQAGVPLR